MREEIQTKLKRKRNILKGIGILEIVGGVSGIGLIFWLALQGLETNTFVLLILLFAIGFYSYSVYAGIRLFKFQENGFLHSEILQWLQIIGISYGGMTYLLSSGGNLFVGYNFTNSTLEFKFSLIASQFQINIMSSDHNNFFYINFMAIAILVLLEKSIKEIKSQKKLMENYEQKMIDYLGTENIPN